MASSTLIPKYILLPLLLVQVVHGKFWHVNVNLPGGSAIFLNSTDVDCPVVSTTEDCDVIWSFSHSIQIETLHFSLDGQRGDFLLISDLPLLFGDSVGNDTELPQDYGDLIASDSLTLMSWESNATSVRVLTKHGAFIHFHREKRSNPSEGPDSSFNISIKNLDFLRLPSTTVPPETTVATEKPGVEVYLSKFVDCMTPEEFILNKEKFKSVVADIATGYCENELNCVGFEGDIITSDDVNIPDDGGLHYCDPLWPVYKTCVEVTLAIVYTNGSSRWLMSKVELEKMWNANEAALKAESFCPYNPPAPLKNLNGFVWVASTLALLLFIMIVLCSAWIWNEPDINANDEDESEAKKSKSEEIQPMNDAPPSVGGGSVGMGGRFFDPDNPIMVVLEKMRKGADDSRYLERKTGSGSSGYNTNNENIPGNGINPLYGSGSPSKVTQNMLFQEQEVTFDFHNPSYQHDDDEGEQQEEHYGYGFPGREQQRSPNQFLSIERDFYDERSDTEI